MSNMTDYRDELNRMRQEFQVQQKLPCTKEENEHFAALLHSGEQLPEGVYPYYPEQAENCSEFCRYHTHCFTREELTEYLTYRNLQLLSTIKNCLVFFTVLTIASLALALLGITQI
ncbi:MAG: hypothetical protein J6J43_05130 [Oscillospiraceae bacterium]|nr:hypothetical protein [Oscillospiraceae bacterium]